MRGAGFTRIVPQLPRPLRLLDLIPSAPMDTGSFDYVPETGTYHPVETAEGAVKPGTQAVFTDAEAKAETSARSRVGTIAQRSRAFALRACGSG
jgi:hypothetical protein